MTESHRTTHKMAVIVGVNLAIALLHFVTGSNYTGPYPAFVNGYLLNILVPFGFYLLLCLNEVSVLRSWIAKGVLVFAVASLVEIAQFLDVPLFGRTFDPLDFVMYGLGVILAAILDTTVFPRVFDFWTPEAKGSAQG